MDYQWLHRAESARLRPTPVAPHILLSFCRKYRLPSGYWTGIEIRSGTAADISCWHARIAAGRWLVRKLRRECGAV